MVVRGNGDVRSSRTQKRSGASKVSKSVEATRIFDAGRGGLLRPTRAALSRQAKWPVLDLQDHGFFSPFKKKTDAS